MRTKKKAHLWNNATRLFSILIVLVAILTIALFLHSIDPKSATPTATSIVSTASDASGYPDANMPCEHYPYATSGKGYWCKNYDWGRVHTENYNDPSEISSLGYAYRNCTDFAAWKVASLGVHPDQYQGLHDAKLWPINAPGNGLTVNTTPAVGAVAVDTRGQFGHVAFISDYTNGVLTVQEFNENADGTYDTRSGTLSDLHFSQVIHFEKYETNNSSSALSPYAGKIVQWNGDTKTQKTSWLVSPDFKRYWIPDSSTYYCLTTHGYTDAGPISSTILNQLPDQTGQWAMCGASSLGTNQYLFRGSYLLSRNGLYSLQLQRTDGNLVLYGPTGRLWANSQSSDFLVLQPDNNLVTYNYSSASATWATGTTQTGANTLTVKDNGTLALTTPGGVTIWESSHSDPAPSPSAGPTVTPTTPPGPTVTPTTPTPTPKITYPEQEGHHGVDTFTNPTNASGMGTKIPAGTWVQVVCKVYAPQIQSVNPDGYWYLIASSPWNSVYYAPANTFMNGDPWNGPYTHNTDFNVPNC